MMVFPTRAVPLKTPETVIDGWASLRGGIESKDLTPLAILSPSAFANCGRAVAHTSGAGRKSLRTSRSGRRP
jgi:hypothetical protein